MPTAAFTTLGCKVNQYETQRILESFQAAGFGIVPFESAADVYVINSCSVTSIAESKSRYTIRRATRFNPTAKVVVTGCAAQMALNKGEELDGVDLMVENPAKLDTLTRFLAAFPAYADWVEREPTQIREAPVGRTRATLKIQDGCSVMCSYCSIPFTRPGMSSRPANEVLAEAQRMAAMGYQEIILTGVLIGAYGPETGSGGPGFLDLVRMLAEQSGVPRIRISSIEMRDVGPGLVGLIQEGLVVPHLHIPLQCGDTGVLRDMNRPYTQADYLSLCSRLKREVPGIALTTDILVGFPTESESRFLSSVRVCDEVGFLKAHVFSFSPRFGTPADQLGDTVSIEEKARRRQVLTEISSRTGDAYVAAHVGTVQRVLVEGKVGKDGLLEGLTDNYITVKFAGPTDLRRTLTWVRIEDVQGSTAFGELVPAPESRSLLRTIK